MQYHSEPGCLGEYEFEEDKRSPPSRAYLKLWELFTRLGYWPQAGDRVLDLGCSPGGWTWVLATQLGAMVVAVDRSPLARNLMEHRNVEFLKGDAFTLTPQASCVT